MATCEKDFTKVSLSIKPLTAEQQGNPNAVKAYNSLITSGKMDICVIIPCLSFLN